MSQNLSSQSRAWSWRTAVSQAAISGECKHLLLTLSLFMNEEGGGCFPTVETLMVRTSKGKSWVHKYLKEAINEGWLLREQTHRKTQNGDNRGWRRNEYQAAWPAENSPKNSTENRVENRVENSDEQQKGSARGEPPIANKVVREKPKGSAREGNKVVREEDTNSPYNNPTISPDAQKRETDAGASLRKIDSVVFEKITKVEKSKLLSAWNAFDGKFTSSQERIIKAFENLDVEDRLFCVDHNRIAAFRTVQKNAGQTYKVAFSSYIAERKFASGPVLAALAAQQVHDAKQAVADACVKLAPFGSAWMAHRLWQLAHGKRGVWKPSNSTQERMYADKPKLFESNIHEAKWRCLTNFPTRLADESQLVGDYTRFVQVAVGSAEWNAWNAWHVANKFPALEPRRGYEWLWVPCTNPIGMGINDFITSTSHVEQSEAQDLKKQKSKNEVVA